MQNLLSPAKGQPYSKACWPEDPVTILGGLFVSVDLPFIYLFIIDSLTILGRGTELVSKESSSLLNKQGKAVGFCSGSSTTHVA